MTSSVQQLIRTFLETVSRNVVLRRRLPKQFGSKPLLVSPGASLKYWKPNLESVDPMLLNIALKYIQNNDIVWDIGANNGLFTFAAASLAGSTGKVLAIEADLWLANLLRRSAKLKENVTLNVDVLPIAISDVVDLVEFNIAKRGRATNYLASVKGSMETGGILEVHLVPCLNLDWLMDKCAHPNFIKIDVEGAEGKVLKGASKLITNARPIILCEVSSKNNKFITNLLKSHDYILYNAAEIDTKVSLDKAAYNTLAYPKEKA